MDEPKKNKLKKVPKGLLLCYAVFLAVWLVRGVVFFAVDRAHPTTIINLEAIQTESMKPLGANEYISTDPDPQILLPELGFWVRRVEMTIEFSRPPGEMSLYYARKPGQGYTPRRRVNAIQQDGNTYAYSLPMGNCTLIRIDPGSTAGNTMEIRSITLNPALPLWRYFEVNLRTALGFALLPALAYCVIYIIMETALALRRKGQRKVS